MVSAQTRLSQSLFYVLAVFFKGGVVFEKMGGMTFDGDRFVGGKFLINGEQANIFSGPGDLFGEIKFGRDNGGGDESAVGDSPVVLVRRERKEPFVAFDAKIAIPTIGEFEGERGFFLADDILVDK